MGHLLFKLAKINKLSNPLAISSKRKENLYNSLVTRNAPIKKKCK